MKNLRFLLFACFCACFVPLLAYGQVQTFPYQNPNAQFFTNSGLPCAGCTLATFAAGTTSNLATYSDSAGTVPNSNPLTLDSAGRGTIYMTSASYKFVLKTALGVTLVTQDNISAANLASTLTSLTLTGNATINSSTAATSGANQSGPSFAWQGNFWNGSASATDSFACNDVLGTGTNPTATLTCTHSGSSGASSISLPAITAASASIGRLQNDCRVDGVHYATIAAAYNDSTNCKSVRVPSGYTETLAANLVLSRSAVPIIFEGTAAITMGTFQITAAGTVNSVSLVAPNCFMSNGSASCVDFIYTGTSQAIVIGDSVTHSKDFLMRGINVTTSGNGASGLRINNLDECEVADSKISITAGTSPIAIITNGTGTFVGSCKFDNVHILSGGGTNAIAYQFQNLSVHIQIVGGNINLDTGASAVCIDVQGAATNAIELMYPNFNTCNTAIKVESSAVTTGAIVGDFRIDSGVTTVANFASGTLGNKLTCINCVTAAAVTDLGGANSVEYPRNNQVNGRFWAIVQGSADYEIVNKLTSKDRLAFSDGNSDTFLDAESPGGLFFNSLSGGTGGFSFCHGDSTHCLFMNPSPTANRTVTWPDASGNIPITPNLLISTTAPSIAAGGCGGAAASIATNNGTAAFSVNVGTTPTSAGCVVTLPTATNGWNCFATDITTNSTSVDHIKQTATGSSTTAATLVNYSNVSVATAPTASDIWQVSCLAR